jgi:DNA modification methylase
MKKSNTFKIYLKDSNLLLEETSSNSIDCLITDPPYGINYQSHEWDKSLPDKNIWISSKKDFYLESDKLFE